MRREISLVRLTRRHFPVILTLARKLLPNLALGKLSKIAYTPTPQVFIDQELHDRLVKYYELDIQALSRFLEGKTPNWFGNNLTPFVRS